ncbi:hypothetical protein ACIA2T_13115 [Amycolatopsis japonica]|uniref:hypothetical protein n=1 Tax=Amycolatopsis japonica TaxID=208439 RepID=UPI0037953407
MKHPLRAAVAATLTALVAFAVGGAPAGADVTPQADDLPPLAIEDFNYPQAAQIQAERGFLLKRGDGHIVLLATCPADTTDPDLLRIAERGQPGSGYVCFHVSGKTGHLTVEMPSVYGVDSGNFTTDVVLTPDDGTATKTYKVPPNGYAGVGESDPTGTGGEYTLVEIKVSR